MTSRLLISLLSGLYFSALSLPAIAAESADPADLVERYREAVRQIEMSSGPYDLQLVEPLRSLASLFSERGDHDQALQLYDRLLHVNRINNGFYHESHLPIIEEMLDEFAAGADWDGLNRSQEYLYWLNQRIYEREPDRLAASLERLFEWKLRFLGLREQEDKSKALSDLEELAEQRIELLGQARGDGPELASALYGRALVHYLNAVAIDDYGMTGRRLVSRQVTPVRDELLFSSRPDAPLTTNEVSRPIILTELGKGRRLLQTALAHASKRGGDAAAETTLMVKLYLADWDLLSGRTGSALRGYREVYGELLELGFDKGRVDAFFSRPKAIPAPRLFSELPEMKTEQEVAEDFLWVDDYFAWSDGFPGLSLLDTPLLPDTPRGNAIASEHDHPAFVEISFAVELRAKMLRTRDPHDSFLRVGRGNVVEPDLPDSLGPERKAQVEKELERLTFRPRLEEGRPVPSPKLRMRYFFSERSRE